MPDTPVRDITGLGTLRLKSSGSGGPADRFSSKSLISASGVISQVENNGTPKFKVRGDGRRNGGILAATPGVLNPGDYYIKTVAGVDYWVFVDSASVEHIITSASVPAGPVALPVGTTVTVDTATSGTSWKWILDLTDSAGFHASFEILGAQTAALTADYTVYPGTSVAPNVLLFAPQIVIVAGLGTLQLVVSPLAPVGWTVTARQL